MTESTQGRDLAERLELIESMVLEGRRSTQYWGWMFLLWGVAYLIAIAWSIWLPRPGLAWPITMIVAGLCSGFGSTSAGRGRSKTTLSRAIGSIWIGVGAATFLFAFSASNSRHGDPHVVSAGIEILLGLANLISSMTLRWRPQLAVALIWWAAGICSFYLSDAMVLPIFVGATLICQIGFGLYLIVLEARDQKRLAHA